MPYAKDSKRANGRACPWCKTLYPTDCGDVIYQQDPTDKNKIRRVQAVRKVKCHNCNCQMVWHVVYDFSGITETLFDFYENWENCQRKKSD